MWKSQITILIIILFLMSGCATNKLPHIETYYYKQCIKPLVQMQELDNKLVKNTMGGAIGGALAGAIIGVIATGRLEGGLVGLGVGAASGAAIGYSFTKLDQITDENTRFASIRITANQDLSKANRMQLYSYECLICYMNEFEYLQMAYNNGKITHHEFSERFREIRNAMIELGKIIGNVDSEILRTEKEFNQIISKSTNLSKVTSTEINKKTESTKPKTLSVNFSQEIAEKQTKIRKIQENNDKDFTDMLDDFAGKATSPAQHISSIEKLYGDGYAQTRQQLDDLRDTHRKVMEIMDRAAIEAGIDMV